MISKKFKNILIAISNRIIALDITLILQRRGYLSDIENSITVTSDKILLADLLITDNINYCENAKNIPIVFLATQKGNNYKENCFPVYIPFIETDLIEIIEKAYLNKSE